ncbi:MAG TPA: hypothetical protein VH116_08705 [Gemmatimonadales bacterium]|nr:hypothetical protein [Gemmatimonadales bacterium]
MTRATALALAGACLAGCGYYNGMWSAEHLAGEAQKAERQDRTTEARTYWAQAAQKAESVMVHHPTSRWADAALVLDGEALARSGACAPAAAPLERAIATVRDAALRERALLARAECALDANDPATAGHALAAVTQSADATRRSRAAFDAGRVATLDGDPEAAAEWFGRSAAPGALAARIPALVAAGRVADAQVLTDSLAHGRVEEAQWAAVVVDVRRAAGPEAASRALDRMLAHRGTPRGVRARLWSADGDALLAAGRTAAAAARYAAVAALVPDSSEGQVAQVRALRVRCVAAESVPQLAAPAAALERLLQGTGAGAGQTEGQALVALIRRIEHQQDRSASERFELAEAVRDSLGAAPLAARLFLDLARQAPTSLFAPKALVAAATLEPERHDSIVAVLEAGYATSPYTLALRGEQSPGFAAAEDSLATALGLASGRSTPQVVGRVGLPVPGPRGPLLDGPIMAARGEAPPPVRPERVAPSGRRRTRPVGDEEARPAVPRDTL